LIEEGASWKGHSRGIGGAGIYFKRGRKEKKERFADKERGATGGLARGTQIKEYYPM